MTINNGSYWAYYFRSSVTRKLLGFKDAIRTKLLPPFDSIADEANDISEESFRRLGQSAANDSVDMGDLAEAAEDEGLAYYETLTAVRQALLNLLAVAVHHIVEQELISFARRELLDRREQSDHSKLTVDIAKKRLAKHGIDLTGFLSFPKLTELRLVANTAKHAEGSASDQLYELRPEMFTDPFIRQAMPHRRQIKTPVHSPLTGDDFYVTLDDLDAYFEAALSLCEELAAALEAQVS